MQVAKLYVARQVAMLLLGCYKVGLLLGGEAHHPSAQKVRRYPAVAPDVQACPRGLQSV